MSSRVGPLAWSLITSAVAVIALPSAAQPVPSVNGRLVSVQRGQTLEVQVDGANLAAVASTGMREPQGLEVSLVKPDKPEDNRARLRLVAAPDAVPGEREIRLISPTGVSNPLRVVVEQYPLLAESEPNDQPQQAQSAVFPAVLVGTVQAAGDVDSFRFEARKGQRLVFDVNAARDGSPLDATVALYDAARREIAADNDTRGTDPFLAVDIPADGPYTFEIRDLRYRGGGDYAYRIRAGAIPFVEALVPMNSQRGKVVEVRAVGHNLHGAERIRLDLTYARGGRVDVRATTPWGVSNALPFEITDVAPVLEAEPNDAAEKATVVALPADVSGRVERGDDEDFYRFTVAQKQTVNLEVVARRFGSPIDALLTLRNAKDGAVIETNDDAAGADARITRELDPGDYVASVRDLTFAGGPDYAYRLTLEPTDAVPREFSARFQPDAIRVHRGGNAALWCDVTRLNGFRGEVTVTLEGLPRGVTASPVTLDDRASGVFTIAASPDANLGSGPVRVRVTAMAGGAFVGRDAQPELNGRVVQEAYLTVLEAAPFAVETLAGLDKDRVGRYAGEIATLAAKLASPDPQLGARQAEWEKKVPASAQWTTMTVTSAQSSGGATLTPQPDGSVLATGPTPQKDIYTLSCRSDVTGIRALRLEVLTDPSLPQQGPGRAPNGNLVLTRFLVTAAPTANPSSAAMVRLSRVTASFEQSGYPAANAIDSDVQGDPSGWAIAPQTGRPHSLIFFTDGQVGSEGGTIFTIVMDHQFGMQHVTGKFRLSASTDANAAETPAVPGAILAVAKAAADQRTPEQKTQLAAYYRDNVDAGVRADRARLDALRTLVAPQAEVARLEELLTAQTPQLDAEMAQWSQRVLAGASWVPLQLVEVKSDAGVTFAREPDGSVVATGAAAPTDNYRVTAVSPLKGVTAVRLEALPDPALPRNGPGRADGGNFALTRLTLAHAPRSNPSQTTPVELHSPIASAEQAGWAPAGLFDERNDTGWAVNSHEGRPVTVTLQTRTLVPGGDDTLLAFTFEHQSQFPRHQIGRFRLWATNALNPQDAPKVPERILALLKNPNRAEPEKSELAVYYRSIAPSLEPVRQRLAEMKSAVGAGRPVAARNQGGAIPVLVTRSGDFASDVNVTLQGFTSGRDGNGPRPIDRSLMVTPLTVPGTGTFGTLGFRVEGGSETGTRMVVLRAETKVGDHAVVTYSPAFPMTVK